MHELVYEPPRDGPTLWEIGIPDRSAAEFYVPDPNPMYINKLYVDHTDRFHFLFTHLNIFCPVKVMHKFNICCSLGFCFFIQILIISLNFHFREKGNFLSPLLAGLGNMVCGKDTLICIQIKT